MGSVTQHLVLKRVGTESATCRSSRERDRVHPQQVLLWFVYLDDRTCPLRTKGSAERVLPDARGEYDERTGHVR